MSLTQDLSSVTGKLAIKVSTGNLTFKDITESTQMKDRTHA